MRTVLIILISWAIVGCSPTAVSTRTKLSETCSNPGKKSEPSCAAGSDKSTDSKAPKPGKGGVVTIPANAIRSSDVKVSWERATDDGTAAEKITYAVFYSRENNISTVEQALANGTRAGEFTKNISEVVVSGLDPATTYYFTVVAQDDAGNYSVYSVAQATTAANSPDATPPIAGVFLASTIVGPAGFKLNWGVASDDVSAASSLQYFVCSGVSAAAIDTVAECEAATLEMTYVANALTVAINGKAPSTTYYYNIVVKDAANNKSIYGGITQATTADTTNPTVSIATLAVSIPSITATSFTVTWNKATDDVSAQSVLQYLAYRSASNNIATVANAETNGTAIGSYTTDISQVTLTGLSVSTAYYVNVIVRDAAGNKSVYTTVSGSTTGDTTPPTASTFSASTSVGVTNFTLNWGVAADDVTTATSLQYLLCSGTDALAIDTVNECEAATIEMSYTTNILTRTITAKTPATTYYYNVVVKDAANNKSVYDGKAQATNADTIPPGNGFFDASTSVSATGFTLNWVPVTDNTSPLYYMVCSGVNTAAIDTIAECEAATVEMAYSASTVNFTISGKAPLTTYYYNVVVKDGSNNKALFNGKSETTLADTTVPTASTFSASTSVGATGFTLNWVAASDNVTAASSLQYFVCSGASAAAIDTVAECEAATTELAFTANTLTLVITGKAPLTTYYYNVVVRDDALNKSLYNGLTQATTADVSPPTVGAFSSSTNITTSTITLNWTAGSDAITATASLQYYVCSGNSVADIDTVAECEGATLRMNWTANTLTQALTGLASGTTFYFNTLVRDAAGNKSVYSGKAESTATPPPTTATNAERSGIVRHSYYDTLNARHWQFYVDGSTIKSQYSTNGSTWVAATNLSATVGKFSLHYKAISGAAYVFLVSEESSHDSLLRRRYRCLRQLRP